MDVAPIEGLQTVFLILLVAIIVFALLARRLATPYPIVLVIGGLLISLIPGTPRLMLNPQIFFFVVLPPLLYSAAWQTSWREFQFNFISIFFLAFGLVTFTVFGVAKIAHWLLPGFSWQAGFVLGAVLSTTDAIAATSIAKRMGLPQRIVDVLEGESLVNDATGLLALEFGVAMVLENRAPSFTEAMVRLGVLVGGGVLVGLAVGFIVSRIERRIDDAPIEITLSLVVPYTAYIAAERLHASGVLAVVVCGLYLSRRSALFFSPSVRIEATAVWNAIDFVLNGIVFVLIGLQLHFVRDAIRGYSLKALIAYGALISVAVIVLRMIWVFPGGNVSFFIRNRFLGQHLGWPRMRGLFIVGWAGMRGVISLAAALALPASFPQRNLILFLAFCVILATLVLQGLSLPWLIRVLGVAVPRDDGEELEARRLVLESALQYLDELREREGEHFGEVYDDLTQHYRAQLGALRGEGGDEHGSGVEHDEMFRKLERDLMRVQRQTAVRLRDEGKIGDAVLRQIQRELDLGETRLMRLLPGA